MPERAGQQSAEDCRYRRASSSQDPGGAVASRSTAAPAFCQEPTYRENGSQACAVTFAQESV